jgi:hypothetical protein
MRRSKTIKRKKYILNTLFVATALLFFDANASYVFKNFAENKLNSIAPEGIKLEIGSIKGGFLRNIVSEDVRISSEQYKRSFTIKHMEINYKLWYALANKLYFLEKFKSNEKIVLIFGNRKDDFIKGFIEFHGEGKSKDIIGNIKVNGYQDIALKGNIDQEGYSVFKLITKEGSIDIAAENKEDGLLLTSKINHIKANKVDIVGECIAFLRFIDGGKITCDLEVNSLIINYMPLSKDFKASLEYDKEDNVLHILKFISSDEEIKGHGSIELSQPNNVFLKWNIEDMNMARQVSSDNIKAKIGGIMNGNFMLKGPIEDINLSAHADIQNGYYENTQCDSAIFNLTGKGPIVEFNDSRLIKEKGYMKLVGEIDLSKLGSNDAFRNFSIEPGENFFIWEGWSFTKAYEDSSVKAEKPLSDELNVSFKAYTNNKEEQEKHFLGVEHKVKF